MQEARPQALQAVAAELTTTLNEARAALEESLEHPGEGGELDRIAELMGQARGVLRVIEIFGGALLAEEMHHTARFLARSSDAAQRAEGLDALIRAVVQLPTYLERVLNGGRDLALVLLPLLNDLRAVRGASLLSEGTLLSLNLQSSQQPPGHDAGGAAGAGMPQLARRLRPRFQVALLALIRGEQVADPLAILAEVAGKVEAAATSGPLFQLWWVVGAVVEALRAGGLEASVSVKRLLGQADRELRRLYELGEEKYVAAPPVDLLNNLLFYVARATSDGPRVTAVKASFRLAELLPVDETVEQEQESLSGPSVKLMHTVAAAIREDLTRVKDALDLFARKGGQPAEMTPQVELLRKIGDTLAVLGLGSLRERVQAELGRLSAVVAGNVPAERDTLIGMAAALIGVEDSLDDALVQLIMPPGAPLAGVIQDPEFRQVAEAVLRECGINLARIKELVAQALEPGGEAASTDAVLPLARGVTAGLLMLGKTRAMEITDRSCALLVSLLRPGVERPDPVIVDRLADALVGIEYYMETLQSGRGDPWYMLDNAERCLSFVESRMAAGATAAEAPAAAVAPPAIPEEPEQLAMARPPEEPEQLAAARPPEEPPLSDHTISIRRPASLDFARLPEGWRGEGVAPRPEAAASADEPVAASEPAPPAVPAAPPPPPAPDHIDPEMVEVFVEEAREELDVVSRLFPLWEESAADKDSLVRVRRAFHTLKGSGRMVGATTLGEVAWSVESLLNRLIEGTRERTPEVVAALREAVAFMPGLVDAVEKQGEAPAGTDALVARVRAVTAGEPVPPAASPVVPEAAVGHEPTRVIATLDEATVARMLEQVPPAAAPAAGQESPAPAVEAAAAEEVPAATAEPPAAAEVGAQETAPAGETGAGAPPPEEEPEAATFAAMDPSLQDIFSKEVQIHLEVFRDFLRRSWVTPGPHWVSDELYRACHTLRGASRTAESQECVRLSDPLHRWLRRLFDADEPFDNTGLATLADAIAAYEDVVESRPGRPPSEATLAGIVSRISALDLALERFIAQKEAEPKAPEEPVVAEEEPPAAGAEEPAPEPSLDIGQLIPAIRVETPAPHGGAGYGRLLPQRPDESGITGEVPYLSAADVAPGAVQAAQGLEAPEAAGAEPELRLPSVIAEVARAEAAASDEAGPAAAVPMEAGGGTPGQEFPAAATGEAPPESPTEALPAIPAAPVEQAPEEGPTEALRALPEDVLPDAPGAAAQDMLPEAAVAAGQEVTEVLPEAAGAAPEEAPEEVPEEAPEEVPEEPAHAAAEETRRPAPPAEIEVEASEPDVGYDADIAAIFSEEATELLEAADGALGALRAARGNRDRVIELQRALHTIKGGARMAGIRAMGDLSHELETLLTQVGGGNAPLDDRSFEVLQASLDELNRMRDFVNAGRAVRPARDLITRIQLVARGATLAPMVEPPPAPVVPEPAAPVEPAPEPESVASPEPEAAAGEAELEPAEPGDRAPPGPQPVLPGREGTAERAEIARVDADLLDAMLNNAGEVSIYRARLEQQLSSVDFNLLELARVVQRLKDQLRKLEIETEAQILHRHVEQAPRRTDFDPLELDRYSSIQQYSRALGETAADVASIQGLLGNLTREAQNLLTQQGRIVTELQDGLMRTRMVPFQRHVQRLSRIVRQAAAEGGKRAELFVEGAAGEIDRQVLDRMLPPLEHLLRNAVVHGIELPAEREARGKPGTGRITLGLKREGSEVVVTVADDGGGINLRAVREKAAALGIVPPTHELSDEQAKQLILEPGFTTAGRVTQSAGRGVGMDVVATEVKKLGGALFIDSEEGRGTSFTIRLPFTLAISQALVVRAGDEYFALPLPTIEGVVRVPSAEVQRQLAGDAAGFEYGGQLYRFRHLSGFVGNEPLPPTERDPAVPVILVRAGEHSTGIVADELVGSREIVVKSVGPQISGIRGISGATILGDGRICIILDVGALVRSDWRVGGGPERPQRTRADERVFALVVDDSITVRRVTQRLLERNGMRVMTAKDGLDAIGVLQDHVPDVILLDIEMPRMDGYEVASHVRNDPRLKDIPIVMITSRVGEKHRARAIELGVNDYLGKPYQETQLLQALEPLLRRKQAS